MTGLTGSEIISTNLYTFLAVLTISECHGPTNGRTELLCQYRPLHSWLMHSWMSADLLQKYYASSWQGVPTPLVCLCHCRIGQLMNRPVSFPTTVQTQYLESFWKRRHRHGHMITKRGKDILSWAPSSLSEFSETETWCYKTVLISPQVRNFILLVEAMSVQWWHAIN